ncbi:hypothetical protein [Vibrio owensii]|uniref:hypothetical protein n=1 Tax=Vibrio owensii TaxID=696485 RepID=UPI0028959E89|nr:membrane hypothetical protein [Vibrio owensii]
MIVMVQVFVLLFSYLPWILLEFRIKSPFLVLPLMSMFIVFPSHSVNLVFGEYLDETYILSTIYISVFNIVMFILRFFASNFVKINFSWDELRNEIVAASTRQFSGIKVTYTLLFLLSISLSLYAATGTFNIFYAANASWWDFVDANPVYKLPSLYITYFLSSLPIVIIFRKDKWLLFIVVLQILYFVLILRTRGAVFSFLMPIFIYIILTKIKNFRSSFSIVFIGLLLVILYFGTREIRLSGGIVNFVQSPPEVEAVFERNVLKGGEFELIRGLYHAFSEPAHTSFFQGNNLLRSIMLPLPSSLTFGIKPHEFTYDVWDFYKGTSIKGGQSFHPTVYGIAYMDMYWFSLVFYPAFLVIYMSILEKIFLLTNSYFRIHILSLMVISGMIIARGSFYNGLAFSFWPLMFTLVFMFLFKRKRFV